LMECHSGVTDTDTVADLPTAPLHTALPTYRCCSSDLPALPYLHSLFILFVRSLHSPRHSTRAFLGDDYRSTYYIYHIFCAFTTTTIHRSPPDFACLPIRHATMDCRIHCSFLLLRLPFWPTTFLHSGPVDTVHYYCDSTHRTYMMPGYALRCHLPRDSTTHFTDSPHSSISDIWLPLCTLFRILPVRYTGSIYDHQFCSIVHMIY